MTRIDMPGWAIAAYAAIGSGIWVALGALWLGMSDRGDITYDAGGPIAARAAMIRAGAAPEIAGYCASSCTMHLSGGCIYPDALLVFHGPQTTDPAAFEHYSQIMARHYPPAIAEWFMAEGRHGEWRMTGAEAIRQGARECEG